MGKVFSIGSVKGKACNFDFDPQKAFGIVTPQALESWLCKADGISEKSALAERKRRLP